MKTILIVQEETGVLISVLDRSTDAVVEYSKLLSKNSKAKVGVVFPDGSMLLNAMSEFDYKLGV